MGKIKKHKLGDFILKERVKGRTYRELEKLVEEEKGISISYKTIQNFVKKNMPDVAHYIQADEEKKEEAGEIYKDAIKQAKKLNKKIWLLLKEFERRDDLRGALKAAAEIRTQLENQNKILSEFSSKERNISIKNLNIKINKFVKQNIMNILNKLESEGLIKLKKKKKIKEFV